MPEEPCQATRPVQTRSGAIPCGSGYKGQKRKCHRVLGGKYCPDDDNGEGVMFRNTDCEKRPCPGKIKNHVFFGGPRILINDLLFSIY